MKTIIAILTLGLLLTSCEQEDNVNQSVEAKTSIVMRQDPVPAQLMGRYHSKDKEAADDFIIIREGNIDISLKSYASMFTIELKHYRTISVVGCYYDIYLDNGTVVRIADFSNGMIYFMIDGEVISILYNDAIHTPPVEQPQTNTPVEG